MVTGGVTVYPNTPSSTVEIYSMSEAKWIAGNPMNTARSSHTATLLSDGRILVAGGFNDGTPIDDAEVYDPITVSWTNLSGAMQTERGGHTATLLSTGPNSGNVLICGGQTADATSITATCEVFDTSGNSFAAVTPMNNSRMGHTANLFSSGGVFVSGGLSYKGGFIYLPDNEIYDSVDNIWAPVDSLAEGRAQHSATVLNNGNVLIVGGYNAVDQLDKFSVDTTTTQYNQNQLSQGFLGSVEMFDLGGARVPVSGEDYDVMPYRNSSHGAVLKPDGKVNLLGGYGNFPVSYFQAQPVIEEGSYLDLTAVGISSSNISGAGGDVKFPLDIQLSREVSGRLVDGNIYFSLPFDPEQPSITIENVEIYMQRSTSVIDGMPIVKDPDTGVGGVFENIVQLDNIGASSPPSLVIFPPLDVSLSFVNVVGSTLNFADIIDEGGQADLLPTSTLTLDISFMVPAIYIGGQITASAQITGGMITDDGEFYIVNLAPNVDIGTPGGVATFTTNFITAFPIGGIVYGLATQTNVVFSSLDGLIVNTTDTLSSPVNAAGDETDGFALDMEFTSSRIELTVEDTDTSYSFDVSTVVVREMVFADRLEYNPKDSIWEFDEEALYLPIFNHNSILTPADDLLTVGGKNCEANPTNDCSRSIKAFRPISDGIVYINQKSDMWTQEDETLNTKRAFHTSTLLPDNSILTCGGSDGTKPLSSCELLDPVTKEWGYVYPMNYTRSNHTATLLANGTVLVAGGKLNSSTAAINTAEIYYPDTEKWVKTASMTYARANHTATLLPDGNVLVAAGGTMSGYSNTSEIYITTEAAWQTVSDNLTTARSQHTATLLKNGNVLVIGGINGGALNSSEIYNRVTRQWSAGPNLNMQRYDHTANLLKDGRALIAGGSDGTQVLKSAEIYNGSNWTYTLNFPAIGRGNDMCLPRANHTSTLLPNGKILVAGGEEPSIAQGYAEGFDVDFSTWQSQGTMQKRVAHTTVLMSDGYLMNIGGFDGVNYLDSAEKVYFGSGPDIFGRETAIDRQPLISSGTITFDKGDRITLLSDTSSFHGITEASGGGAGPMNSSHHNPRVYIQQIDNPSGFLTDLTTSLYTLYGSQNTDWKKTTSSITLIMPPSSNQLPYGFYNFWVANNGVFSNGYTVQVTSQRPTGIVANLLGTVASSTTINWSWNIGTVASSDGYAIFSSSNNVFIAISDIEIFSQATLTPNTMSSVKVAGYNTGGYGEFVKSATYYTLAAVPQNLTINNASFETADLEWSPNFNSDITTYELSMSASTNDSDCFTSNISTPIIFDDNYTSTSTTLNQLSSNQFYCFRVRAKNGAGEITDFSAPASTITVGSITNLQGTAISISEIRWSWDPTVGASSYTVYDVTDGTESAVFVTTASLAYAYQTGLSTNTPHIVRVIAFEGANYGPPSISPDIYTFAVAPLPGVPNALTNISTGSMRVNWIANGNSNYTEYSIAISDDSNTDIFYTTGTNISVEGLTPNTKYTAKITAYNGAGSDEDEDEDEDENDENENPTETLELGSKYTKAQPPINVTTTSISMSGVIIEWETGDNPDTTCYEIRGSTDNFVTISTYVAFSDCHTASSIEINGLMTSTTYYFDVTAINGELLETAKIQCVPNALTLAGPNGAPKGSIAGTSDPSKTTIIDGVLPVEGIWKDNNNGRRVIMSIPSGSFPAATDIAISSSATNSCNYLLPPTTGKPLEVAIYSENNSQPQVPITLTLAMNQAERNIISPTQSQWVLARYNPVSGQCLPLKTTVNVGAETITATLNHFSIFQLIKKTAAADLNNISIYPNPFYSNRGHGFVTIDNIPASSEIRIYTLSGIKVWEGNATPTGLAIWDGTNKYGELVASGIYLCVIDSSAGKKIIKLAVER